MQIGVAAEVQSKQVQIVRCRATGAGKQEQNGRICRAAGAEQVQGGVEVW